MLYRIEWNTGRTWEPIGFVYRSLCLRVHQHPVDAFFTTEDHGGPKRVLTQRARAVPCLNPKTPKVLRA